METEKKKTTCGVGWLGMFFFIFSLNTLAASFTVLSGGVLSRNEPIQVNSGKLVISTKLKL